MTPWHFVPSHRALATHALCHPSKSPPLPPSWVIRSSSRKESIDRWGEIAAGRTNTLNSAIRQLLGIAGQARPMAGHRPPEAQPLAPARAHAR